MADTIEKQQLNISSRERKKQLLQIMEDAVTHVLERPDVRRGPYVISDSDIQLTACK